jgi:hypothetical protein
MTVFLKSGEKLKRSLLYTKRICNFHASEGMYHNNDIITSRHPANGMIIAPQIPMLFSMTKTGYYRRHDLVGRAAP